MHHGRSACLLQILGWKCLEQGLGGIPPRFGIGLLKMKLLKLLCKFRTCIESSPRPTMMCIEIASFSHHA